MIAEARLYCASLSDYNAGRLEGKWIDISDMTDSMEIHEEISEMLKDIGEYRNDGEIREEWAIHDFELPAGIKCSEWASSEELQDILDTLAAIEEYGEAVIEAANHCEVPIEQISGRYEGTHKSISDWAYDFYEQCGSIPEGHLANYIDWESVARDEYYNGSITYHEVSFEEVVVFRNE